MIFERCPLQEYNHIASETQKLSSMHTQTHAVIFQLVIPALQWLWGPRVTSDSHPTLVPLLSLGRACGKRPRSGDPIYAMLRKKGNPWDRCWTSRGQVRPDSGRVRPGAQKDDWTRRVSVQLSVRLPIARLQRGR